MNGREFEVNGITYTHLRLDAFSQLHVSRKGAPLFIGVSNQKWFQVLYDLSKEDLDFMLEIILPYVKRKNQLNTWVDVYNKSAKSFYFEDIDGGQLLEILFEVLLDYLPDFITAAGRMVSGTAKEVQTSE